MRGRQTVSFAVTASGPARRVRALLERVRPHVDEIVLAVDRHGDLDAIEACGDLADRRLTFEVRRSPARLIGWILDQCAADWVLRLDDDEVPSDALLDALPTLTSERHPLAFHLRRHWLHPAADRYIASRPWSVDYQQARLVRNLPGAWTFDGAVHTVGETEGEQRFVELPIYHADLLVSSVAARRAKRVRYESEWPEVEFGGAGANEIYVPEEVAALEHAPVPAADAAAVQAVIEGSATGPRSTARGRVRHASFEEVDLFNLRRMPDPEGFAASVALEDPPDSVDAARIHHLFVVVANTGTEPWLWVPRSEPVAGRAPPIQPARVPVRVEWEWRDTSGEGRPFRGGEVLTEAVWPGETTRVPADVRAPSEPGDWELDVGVERGGKDFARATYRVRVQATPPISAPSRATAELAAMRHRITRERARARKATEQADELTRLRRYRVAAWITRRNGANDGSGP